MVSANSTSKSDSSSANPPSGHSSVDASITEQDITPIRPTHVLAAGAPSLVMVWLMDTGCGFDLVQKSNVDHLEKAFRPASQVVRLNTANGETVVKEEISLKIPQLSESIRALILDSTPDVLSIGQRVVEKGYDFYWRHKYHNTPLLVTPSGQPIALEVSGNIPYLRGNTPCASVTDQTVSDHDYEALLEEAGSLLRSDHVKRRPRNRTRPFCAAFHSCQDAGPGASSSSSVPPAPAPDSAVPNADGEASAHEPESDPEPERQDKFRGRRKRPMHAHDSIHTAPIDPHA